MRQSLHQENISRIFIENPTICGMCATNGPTCCQCGIKEEELVAPLSEAELRRIQKLAPWVENTTFVVREKNSPFFISEMAKLFPDHPEDIKSSFPVDSFHLRLAQNSIGQCVFLGPQGCLLPKAARPHFCNLYPFWFIGRNLHAFENHLCLALQHRNSIPKMCTELHTHPDDLFQAYLTLCQDWGVAPPSQDLQVEIQ
ncbi:MAG: hypothetical protein OEY01_04545 [Desulfobulbaceae bacterium]|nr:hypothetical protein [Desulfobulbaceae bacterium]HIJ78449.1 hypothetical protein [Deltaproteobacteria bacterium]